MATEPQGTTFAVFFVSIEKIHYIASDRTAKDLGRFVKYVPQNVRSVFFAGDKPRTRKKVAIRSASDNAFGHMATCSTVTLPRQAEFQLVLNRP